MAPTRTEISYCRICAASCGTLVEVVDDRVTKVVGDRDNPMSGGYTCVKGRAAGELMNGPDRLTRSVRRTADGEDEPITMAEAAAEVGAKLREIVSEHGPDAVALFMGTQQAFTTLTPFVVRSWFRALGSHKLFSTMTIDQSAKWLVPARMGEYLGGMQAMAGADVWLFAGTNPLVSASGGDGDGLLVANPINQLKSLQSDGMRLVVIDPRRTETAARADLHLRPRPGTDAVLFAGLLHVVLERGWYDEDFCAEYVDGLDELRAALTVASPDRVSAFCDIEPDDLVEVARLFGTARRGRVTTGTGVCFGPHSNLAEHLADTLNIVCGRLLRAGEPAWAGDVLLGGSRPVARVAPPTRTWEEGFRSRVDGHGRIRGELPASLLPEEILRPGGDRVRALLVSGANPMLALPDQRRTREALENLDLLVTVDTRMTETARVADYVIAATMLYERADHTALMEFFFPEPFAQWAPALVSRPGEVVDDWEFYVRLGREMGLQMKVGGQPLDLDHPPSSEVLLARVAGRGRVDPAVLRAHRHGMRVAHPGTVVAPRPEGDEQRLVLLAPDVAEELGTALAEIAAVATRPPDQFLLVSRRLKEVVNSLGRGVAGMARLPYNPAYFTPDDMTRLGLSEADEVVLTSDAGEVRAYAHPDATLRAGTVALAHGWGALDPEAGPESGTNVNLLTNGRTDFQPINRMPRFTAVPVRVRPAREAGTGGGTTASAPARPAPRRIG